MLVKTYCAAVRGISALTVTIEVNISMGINFFIVGLVRSAEPVLYLRNDARDER